LRFWEFSGVFGGKTWGGRSSSGVSTGKWQKKIDLAIFG